MMNVNVSGSGIIRGIDDLGRIVIPKEIRRSLEIGEGTQLEIKTTSDGGIYLRKPDSTNTPTHDDSESTLVRFFDIDTNPVFARLSEPTLKFAHWLEENGVNITEGYDAISNEDFPTF